MIYMEATQLGWTTLVKSWMAYSFPSNLSIASKTTIQVGKATPTDVEKILVMYIKHVLNCFPFRKVHRFLVFSSVVV